MTMDKISSVAVEYMELGPLAGLSIQRTQPGVTPNAPSNEDRARAFRNVQPVALANDFKWPFRRTVVEQPAAAQLVAVGAAKPEEHVGVRWLNPVHALHHYVAGRSQRSDMHDSPASILPISRALTGATR